jgi:hypothetical protein
MKTDLKASKHIVMDPKSTFRSGRPKFAVYFYTEDNDFISKHDAMKCTNKEGIDYYVVSKKATDDFSGTDNEFVNALGLAMAIRPKQSYPKLSADGESRVLSRINAAEEPS